MNLTPLFPDLQAISRSLQELYSSVKFSYSETAIRLQAKVDKPEYTLYALLIWLSIVSTFSIVTFLSEEYPLSIMSVLFGLFSVWHTYRTRKKPPSMKVVRLQNEVVINTLTRRIMVEHLHPYFRQYAAETTEVSFAEVLQVVAEGEEYGQVYVVLTDETRLYLIEVESKQVALSIARVLQQILGLPVDPKPKAWWQF